MTYSVLQFLISFQEAPWRSLFYYIWAITTTWRSKCATSIRFKISKFTVSYQYISDLWYRGIHLMVFISCYCTSIYNEYIILLCLFINPHKTLLISKIIIINIFLSYKFRIYSFCDIFKVHFFAADTESSTFLKALGVYREFSKSCQLFIQYKGASV